ncbi:MAG: DUF1156 domain-containing protein [Anaerolineae bacterium]|nr:DUF1156 domain-containing protein [Anaerolineae bacterium]
MESYKERKANYSQTLTGLGKWWGRKPLVLVRAALLGLLLPASPDPEKDRDIFLKLMTMDSEGLWRRKSKVISGKRLVAELLTLPSDIQQRYLDPAAPAGSPQLQRLAREDRDALQQLVFERMSYSEKLQYCDRPEQLPGPTPAAWQEINTHLSTNVTSLSDLVEELGQRRFGRRPRVGDVFCGGGSIPFEAARLGCDVYGSDLNPVAALLTWASLNIIGGGEEVAEAVADAQQQIFDAVDRQITEWGIEHNSLGWRADAYLYCVEVTDPESGWQIPLAPNWVIGQRTRTIAKLVPDEMNKRYDIEIHSHVSSTELQTAKQAGTIKKSRLMPPHGGSSTPIEVIRHEMRLWENDDLVPRPDDIFQERLYCIRWVETYVDKNGNLRTRRHYRAPTPDDLQREESVLILLRERFHPWQDQGYISSRRIVPGQKTNEPIRSRGWSHWHHLFTPRQLLTLGLLQEFGFTQLVKRKDKVTVLLGVARCSDWNSKLCRWDSSTANEKVAQTFSNQALNPLYNYAGRGLIALESSWFLKFNSYNIAESSTEPIDARQVQAESDIWITDPPYADAINYHELSEYLLAWYEKLLGSLFKDWYTDSKRALAVQGNDIEFRRAMVDAYRRLAEKMPDNGLQIVMFTHQDAGVWADLTLVLWAAGLHVTQAWTIATETDSALRQGNYVQGTVLLVLRKRLATHALFLDEITPEVELEVRRQLDAMLTMEDDSDPNFGDADYQLAAYAAVLRVLTAQPIEEINPEREILRERRPGEISEVEKLIREAVKIACDHLVPKGFSRDIWRWLSPLERFYLKGLDVESHAEYRNSVYQELARGFGAADYSDLLANTRANETRLKNASEFGKRGLTGAGFNSSLVRHSLFAVYQVGKNQHVQTGLNWLKTELPDYWSSRERLVHILDYLASLARVTPMAHWHKDGQAAELLAGAVRNDHI